MVISAAEANVELSVLDSRAQEYDRIDAFARFTNAGLPQEIVQRLRGLWDAREEIAGRAVHIGKIIFMEINRFVDENPNLAMGIAVGAACGALTAMIPFIGPLLAPFILVAGVLMGAIKGYEMDAGKKANDEISKIAQDLIAIARKFFQLLADILKALRASTKHPAVEGAQ